MTTWKRTTLCCLSTLLAGLAPVLVTAQDNAKPVVIQRRQISLTPAEAYRVPLRLEPIRSVTIYAPFDATVKSVVEKLEGRAVDQQFELLRLDNQRVDLAAKRAIAGKTVAEQEMRIARANSNADNLKYAEAKLAFADAEVALAILDQSAASVRAPYAGNVMRVLVQEGQQVRAGEPLLTFGDVKKLKCRLPVDREVVKVGATIDLMVEAQTVKATVETVTVLDAEHDKQRELAVSAATAVAIIDNNFGEWHPGQVVYGPLSPTGPVASVPLTSLKTGQSGDRVLPVLREGLVRLIPITLHGQVGKTSVHVSGQFTERDEFVISSSTDLADGMAVRPAGAGVVAAAKSGSGPAAGAQPGANQKPDVPNAPKKPGAAGF